MIEMSTVYFLFALLATAAVAGFTAYWIGIDKGEKASFTKRWDEQTDHMERIQKLMAVNHALRLEIDRVNDQFLYPETVWNNERTVPEQPQ